MGVSMDVSMDVNNFNKFSRKCTVAMCFTLQAVFFLASRTLFVNTTNVLYLTLLS